MSKLAIQYVCQACGAVSAKWAGSCAACGAWNTIVDEPKLSGIGTGPKSRIGGGRGKSRGVELELLQGTGVEAPRTPTTIAEFDRVTGGGLVPGSALLVGGDPGIGKSTIILQALAALAKAGQPVAYISGEEAVAQVRLRANRLGLSQMPVRLAAETNVGAIIATLESQGPFAVAAIDSIQTMWCDNVEAAPGTVSQVRASVQELIRFSKKYGTALLLVGHVTKDGQIAGPRVVEHMVDAVLYFEGDRGHQFRILRAVKNRFGPTDEIGVFEMTDKGLAEVANPSLLFLSERGRTQPGTAVFAGVEGTRPLLVEIQALVAPANYGSPRRAVVGWDSGRLAMLLAVLEARCGLGFASHDVYLNVAGGLKITEPAADLAAAGALISALLGKALPSDGVIFGEVALSGAIRPVSQAETRLKEAAKLGFKKALTPLAKGVAGTNLAVTEVDALSRFLDEVRRGA